MRVCRTNGNVLQRYTEVILPGQILLWCMLSEPVFGSVINGGRDASKLGEEMLNAFGRPFASVTPKENVSALCREHSELYLQELSNLTPWAIKMYDASTTIPSGLVTGNIQQMGNYDECLAIEMRKDDKLAFRGKQCSATFQFRRLPGAEISTDLDMKDLFRALLKASDSEDWKSNDSAPYVWALCVPSSCSASDVQSYFNEALLPLNVENRVQVMLSVLPETCSVAEDTDMTFTGAEIGIIILIAIFTILLIGSTSYDLITNRNPQKKDKSRTHAIFMSFSLYTNGKGLISTNIGSETMTCLHGLRFLSISWIIFGHTYYMETMTPNINHIAVKYYDRNAGRMLVMNATVSTDTFFVLSGCLLCYTFMREWEKRKAFNVIIFYVHRYIRLTPPYAFMVFFYVALLYHLGSGPLWNSQIGLNRDFCVENWWTNLLYINNYIDIGRMCMNQTWYLAVDMQLFWLSPLLIYPLARWPKIGKWLIGITLITSVVTPLAVTVAQQLTAIMLYNKDLLKVSDVYMYIYTRTYTRAGPYIVGIILGYLLHKTRGKTVTVPKIYVALGWLTSVTLLAVIVFGGAIFYNDKHEYNAWEAGFYAGLHRTVWSLAVAWIAFACIKGYGGPVDAFLSWKFFVPMSRLTYCAYLCHYIFLLYNVASRRTPGYLSDYNMVHESAGNFVLSFLLAAVISLAFEIPFMNLDKILLRPTQSAPKTKEKEPTTPADAERNLTLGESYDNMGFKDDNLPYNRRVTGVYVITDQNDVHGKGSELSAIPLEFEKYED